MVAILSLGTDDQYSILHVHYTSDRSDTNFIILDGARNASVDNRPKWLWKKFFISYSWWTVASLQRVPGQTTS